MHSFCVNCVDICSRSTSIHQLNVKFSHQYCSCPSRIDTLLLRAIITAPWRPWPLELSSQTVGQPRASTGGIPKLNLVRAPLVFEQTKNFARCLATVELPWRACALAGNIALALDGLEWRYMPVAGVDNRQICVTFADVFVFKHIE